MVREDPPGPNGEITISRDLLQIDHPSDFLSRWHLGPLRAPRRRPPTVPTWPPVDRTPPLPTNSATRNSMVRSKFADLNFLVSKTHLMRISDYSDDIDAMGVEGASCESGY